MPSDIERHRNSRQHLETTPYRAARIMCGSDYGNPCTGIWHGKEKTEQYIKGANSDWRLLKSLICSHLLGISNTAHGKQHFLALKEFEDDQKLQQTVLSATKAQVKCMITDVKMKAASTHYETLLALLDDCRVNIGKLTIAGKKCSHYFSQQKVTSMKNLSHFK